MRKNTLTAQRLREVLTYDATTGYFYWKARLAQADRTGHIAGSVHPQGYVVIQIDNCPHKAHRLAWFYMNGVWPTGEIDHINGVRADNSISNLRDVSANINQQNQRKARTSSASGFLGVTWHKAAKKWAAQIGANKRKFHLGVFSTPEDAHAAYLAAKRRLHAGCTL